MVSVNPIDEFNWGAASLSDQTDRCYLILTVTDRANTKFGSTRYGWLPKGAQCTGAAAVPETVTGSEWPDQGREPTNWVDTVVVGVFFWAPLAAALLWSVTAVRRAPERGIAAWRWVPTVVLFGIAWWIGAVALLGSMEQSWNELDFGSLGSSIVWCLLAGMVPAAAVLAFLVGKRRCMRDDQILRVMAIAVLIPGVVLGFVVVAGSII